MSLGPAFNYAEQGKKHFAHKSILLTSPTYLIYGREMLFVCSTWGLREFMAYIKKALRTMFKK